jgi:hypothetical protein
MKSRFHEAAEVELAEAVEYYDFATEGLGNRLLNEVISAVEHIETLPEIATVVEYNVRGKCLRASHARCRSIWPTYPPVTLVYSSCTRAAGRKPGA